MIMSFSNTLSYKSAKSTEIRKIRKPLMEKKRRARINSSLNELKKMILSYSTTIKEDPRPAKLEKADILEMTVRHLQRLHQLVLLDGRSPDGVGGFDRPSGTESEETRVPSWEWQRGRGDVLCCSRCGEGGWKGGGGRGKVSPIERWDPPTPESEEKAEGGRGASDRVGGASATAQFKSRPLQPPMARKAGGPAVAPPLPPEKEGGREVSEGRCRVWRPWQVARSAQRSAPHGRS